jgi:hypothetical protein
MAFRDPKQKQRTDYLKENGLHYISDTNMNLKINAGSILSKMNIFGPLSSRLSSKFRSSKKKAAS